MSDNITVINMPKAMGLGEKIDSIQIRIDTPVREFTSMEDAREYYQGTAQIFVNLILRTLPGGLTDAILAELMRKKASILAVPAIGRDDQTKNPVDFGEIVLDV